MLGRDGRRGQCWERLAGIAFRTLVDPCFDEFDLSGRWFRFSLRRHEWFGFAGERFDEQAFGGFVRSDGRTGPIHLPPTPLRRRAATAPIDKPSPSPVTTQTCKSGRATFNPVAIAGARP